MPGYSEWCHCVSQRSLCLLNREPLSGTNRGVGWVKQPPGLLPGWLLPSQLVKSHCAGSRPGWELNTWWMQEWDKNTREGELIWVEMKGMTFSVLQYKKSLLNSHWHGMCDLFFLFSIKVSWVSLKCRAPWLSAHFMRLNCMWQQMWHHSSLTGCSMSSRCCGLRLSSCPITGHPYSHSSWLLCTMFLFKRFFFSPQGTGRLPTSESSPATGYLSSVQKPEAVVHAMKVFLQLPISLGYLNFRETSEKTSWNLSFFIGVCTVQRWPHILIHTKCKI